MNHTHCIPTRSLARTFALFGGILLALAATAAAQPLAGPAVGEELIVNGSLKTAPGQKLPEGWQARGNPAHARAVPKPANAGGGEGGMFEFAAKNSGVQQVVVIEPVYRTLELRFRMKTEDVARGEADWQNARMALRFIDDGWKPVTPWPKSIGKSGTHDWTEHTVTLTVPAAARSLVVEPAMFGDSGTVWFSDISLRVLEMHEP